MRKVHPSLGPLCDVTNASARPLTSKPEEGSIQRLSLQEAKHQVGGCKQRANDLFSENLYNFPFFLVKSDNAKTLNDLC